MTIEKSSQEGTVVLKLNGWLDSQASPVLGAEIDGLDGSVTSLIIDCGSLQFISSAGLRQIVSAHKKMNGAMTMRNVPDQIMNIIKMTGLAKRLHFEADHQG